MLLVGLTIAALVPALARAETVDLIVDSAKLEFASADDGTHTVKVTLANIMHGPAVIDEVKIAGQPGCAITPNPTDIASGRRTVIKLTFDRGCKLSDGVAFAISFHAPVTPRSYTLTASPASAEAHWYFLGYGFVAGIVAALVLAVVIGERIRRYNQGHRAARLRPSTPLKGLGTNWSFKDNWVGSVTVGSSVLVALLATSGVLDTILGFEPEAALAIMAVGGAIAAVLVGIAPLFVKMIGDDLAVPTILGTLLAACVTIVGSIGQIALVAGQSADLASGLLRYGIYTIGAIVAGVVFAYGLQALWSFIDSGVEQKEGKKADVLQAGEMIARAIRREPEPEQPAPAGVGTSGDGDMRRPSEPEQRSAAQRPALL